MKPRPQDDEAIAEMCRWLKKNQIVALTNLSGKMTLIPAEEFYGHDENPSARNPRPAV